MKRDDLLNLTLEELARLCRVESFRGVGPGGQKRNKTETAVRVTLESEGLSAFDDQTRSQHQNKHHALRKLRLLIALNCRQVPGPWTAPVPSPNSPAWETWLGAAIDALEEKQYHLAEAAALLGCSTNQLAKNLGQRPAVWQFLNQQRQQRGLSPLRMNP